MDRGGYLCKHQGMHHLARGAAAFDLPQRTKRAVGGRLLKNFSEPRGHKTEGLPLQIKRSGVQFTWLPLWGSTTAVG